MTGSRGFWTRIAAFALVGVLLGALAAFLVRGGGDSGPGEADAPASSATLAAIATDHPSSAPPTQPSASEAPTAQPAAEPTAAGSKRTSLAAFVKHVSAAIKDGQALIEPLQQAAQAFDIKATKRCSVGHLRLGADRTVLARPPPAACLLCRGACRVREWRGRLRPGGQDHEALRRGLSLCRLR